MTNDRFFRAFLAALRESGLDYLVTQDDIHHRRFKAALKLLPTLVAEQKGEIWPRFIPSPFTGRYRELEDALVQMQHGLLGAQNPFYFGIRLEISREIAKDILERFPPDQQQLFRKLAKAYNEDSDVSIPSTES